MQFIETHVFTRELLELLPDDDDDRAQGNRIGASRRRSCSGGRGFSEGR